MSEKSKNWQNMASLHFITSAAAHKIYLTLNNCVQPELRTKTLNIRPIIDRVSPPSFGQGLHYLHDKIFRYASVRDVAREKL